MLDLGINSGSISYEVALEVLGQNRQPFMQAIHEERVDIDAIELHFRPVYAFEYEWTSKNKRVVVEFDPVTTEIHGNGRRLQDQIKNIVSRDLLFDITADAAGLLVPGGSIAVKLVKAVVDRR